MHTRMRNLNFRPITVVYASTELLQEEITGTQAVPQNNLLKEKPHISGVFLTDRRFTGKNGASANINQNSNHTSSKRLTYVGSSKYCCVFGKPCCYSSNHPRTDTLGLRTQFRRYINDAHDSIKEE